MGLLDTAYMGAKLAGDPMYGRSCGSSQLAKTLAVHDRSDPGAARAVIVAGSDFEGTSPKLFWPETLVYLLPGAELNQMLTLIVAMKSKTPCEPELFLFAGMNDHLHAAGLLEPLRSGEPLPKKIWEAIQTLFASMNEMQELVTSRLGSKTRVVFPSSPGYVGMSPALQFVYAMLILIAEVNGWRMLMTAPNCELEPVNLRFLKSEVAAAWADMSQRSEGLLRACEYLDRIERGRLSGGAEPYLATEVQPGSGGSPPCEDSSDSQPVVPEYGADNHEFHKQEEGSKQREKECGCSRKTSEIDGIPPNTRERKMDVPDPET